MIETCHLKNIIFLQTILSFLLSRKTVTNSASFKYKSSITVKALDNNDENDENNDRKKIKRLKL